ncbi:hypothetical protein BDW62DRAFT_125060 [Aspergillus aurantiobrunneus]
MSSMCMCPDQPKSPDSPTACLFFILGHQQLFLSGYHCRLCVTWNFFSGSYFCKHVSLTRRQLTHLAVFINPTVPMPFVQHYFNPGSRGSSHNPSVSSNSDADPLNTPSLSSDGAQNDDSSFDFEADLDPPRYRGNAYASTSDSLPGSAFFAAAEARARAAEVEVPKEVEGAGVTPAASAA